MRVCAIVFHAARRSERAALPAPAGTAVGAPDGGVLILTARHCVIGNRASVVYPWSTYSILFDYKLACNATSVANVTTTFNRFLQGLAVEYLDAASDVAVLRVLQDVPPEWDVVLAGWDARNLLDNFAYVTVSQPKGDVQKVAYGE